MKSTWDDFIALFDGLTEELEKLIKSLEGMRIAHNSLSETYGNLSKTYQEQIDWCEAYIKEVRK